MVLIVDLLSRHLQAHFLGREHISFDFCVELMYILITTFNHFLVISVTLSDPQLQILTPMGLE